MGERAWRYVGYVTFALCLGVYACLQHAPTQAAASASTSEVSGTVWLDSNNNGAWDSSDVRYPDCPVFFQAVEPEIPDVIRTSVAFSDEYGRFEFQIVQQGDHRLWAEMEDHVSNMYLVRSSGVVTRTTDVVLLMPPHTSYLPILAVR